MNYSNKLEEWKAKASILGILDDFVFGVENKTEGYYDKYDNFQVRELDEKIVTLERYTGKHKELELPPVYKIQDSAFSRNTIIEKITIPESVHDLGHYVFRYCFSLKEVIIKGDIKLLPMETFLNCVNLHNIILNESLLNIWQDVFFNCESLEDIKLPKSLSMLDNDVFCNAGIRKLIIPENVDIIGSNCFSSDKLEHLEIHSKSNILFLGSDRGEKVLTGQNIKSIKVREINYEALKKVTPEKLHNIIEIIK